MKDVTRCSGVNHEQQGRSLENFVLGHLLTNATKKWYFHLIAISTSGMCAWTCMNTLMCAPALQSLMDKMIPGEYIRSSRGR